MNRREALKALTALPAVASGAVAATQVTAPGALPGLILWVDVKSSGGGRVMVTTRDVVERIVLHRTHNPPDISFRVADPAD